MNYQLFKIYSQEMRDDYLRKELGEEKCEILDKYGLRSNTSLYWERQHEHQPVQEYFSHKFAKKASPLGMIFHIYKLCYAKVKYFDQNWDDFAPCIYNWKSGLFEETKLSNMEFIKHLTPIHCHHEKLRVNMNRVKHSNQCNLMLNYDRRRV